MDINNHEYGLYLVPDYFPTCQSISKGIDWGGPHITLAGFTSNNYTRILLALDYLRSFLLSKKTKIWKLKFEYLYKPNNNQFNISGSETLTNLTNILKNFNLEKLREPGQLHIFCSNGIYLDNNILKPIKWGLFLVKKNQDMVNLIPESKLYLFDIHKKN